MSANKMDMVLTRGSLTGVLYGEFVSQTETHVTLRNVRQVWGWNGPQTLTGLAELGPEKNSEIDSAASSGEILRSDLCAVFKVSAKAQARFDACLAWSER